MIKHIKKVICFGFILILSLSCILCCLVGCKNIEDEVDAEFAKYTLDEDFALNDKGIDRYVFFPTHRLCLADLMPNEKVSYKDRGYVIYQRQVYFTRTVKHDNKSYPCIYICDLYGNGIELVVELSDANYVGSNGYDKTLYLEFKSTKDAGNSIIKSYNVETGEYKYELTGMDVDDYVQVLIKTQRQEFLHKLGVEINIDDKNNSFNIEKDGTNIIVNKEKLEEYDFGQALVKYDGKAIFNQIINEHIYLGYKVMLYELESYAIVILEFDINNEQLIYKSYIKSLDAIHYKNKIDCIRQIN